MGSPSAWKPRLEAILEAESGEGRFSGAVLVAHGEQRLFCRAYGMEDRERGSANRIDTRFRNGSVTKLFTAVAVGRLIQDGRVDPHTPVGAYLPGYPNPEVASKVTVHHLLTHTGGTGDFIEPEYFARHDQLREITDYVELFGGRAPAFEPGAWFDYSNFGFVLLGAVIEQVSGVSYDDFVNENVFGPAGMTRTGTLPESVSVEGRAIAYSEVDLTPLPYRGTPAGGGYATVEDLHRFALALTGHRLLDAEHTDLLTTGKVNMGWSGRYGYGFTENTIYGVRSFGHGGGAPGTSADLAIYPGSGHVVAVLANQDPPIAQQVCEFIGHRLPVTGR